MQVLKSTLNPEVSEEPSPMCKPKPTYREVATQTFEELIMPLHIPPVKRGRLERLFEYPDDRKLPTNALMEQTPMQYQFER